MKQFRNLVGSHDRVDRREPLAVSVCQRAYVTGGQLQVLQCPGAGIFQIAGYLDEASRDSREECYLKAIERDRQAPSDRLNEGFFSSPATEKTQDSLVRFQGEQFRCFFGGKEARRD